MLPSHHLQDETLQDYAAGSLSVPMETLIACHLTVCPSCRMRAHFAEQLGGQLLAQQDSVEVNFSARDILSMTDKHPAHPDNELDQAFPATDNIPAGVPRPLARLLPAPLEELKWRSFAPGLKQFSLSDQPRREGAFKLISADPGSVLGEHTHKERELTFIVSGSYVDELGHFKAGDIADLDSTHLHRPVVDSTVPCVSLIATDAPVQFSGLLGKMVQPFVGI